MLSTQLGRAHHRAGDFLAAREAFLRAAATVRLPGFTDLFVRIANEHGLVTDSVNLPAAPALELLEEALQKLGPEETPTKAKSLSYLARLLANNGMQERALAYGKQAVEIARRFVDERSLVDHAKELFAAREGMITALQLPEYALERLIYLNEQIELDEKVGLNDTLAVNLTYHFRAVAFAELGEMDRADKDAGEHRRHAERWQTPFSLSVARAYAAMRAMMQGRFADSEHLAEEAFEIGQKLQIENAAGVFGLQIFTLRREQGRLKEVAPAVRHFVEQNQAAATWRPGLAVIYTELANPSEATSLFEQLAQHNFDDILRDSLWMTSMTYVVDVCTFLGDISRAAMLYKILLPFADCNVCGSNGFVCFGSMSRYLGALAAALGRWKDAEHHFEDALQMNMRIGARPWLAHTQYQYARMLLSRDQAGDSDKAEALLKDALSTARHLGMRALEERITSGSP
jgi:tetratricopeptide (TPR) repeat protein